MDEGAKREGFAVGIIMDGNRRWAKEHRVPSFEGHRRGYEKLKDVLDWSKELGVKELTAYAFSTENWERAKEEVAYLMDLFRHAVSDQLARAKRERTKLLFPGDRERFPEDIRRMMEGAESETKGFSDRTVAIALSYGGRAEILDAVKKIPPDELATLDEASFSRRLWTRDLRDPDMIIRTSGEQRLSGFLTWKSVYSELFFTPTFWPAFTREEFVRMLEAYGARKRRFGV